jgi:multidrug resistance efflux pump
MSWIHSHIKFAVLTPLLAMSVQVFADSSITEEYLAGRNEARQSRERKIYAQTLREKAKATLTQADFVYAEDVRLRGRNAVSEMELLNAHMALLQASMAYRRTVYVEEHESLDERIWQLRSAWIVGSKSRSLKDLAKIYVEIRQKYVAFSEGLLSDMTMMARDRQESYEMKAKLVKTHAVSLEEFNEASVFNQQAKEELKITDAQLKNARTALAEALNDLENTD